MLSTMKKTCVLVALGVVLAATTAQGSEGRKNLQVFNDVAASINRYDRLTIFDDVNIGVKDGDVTLTGEVTLPLKRDDIEKRVAKVDGVQAVRNRITVLPVSPFDDQLRVRLARSIYGNYNFWNYGGANPSIHIVVENGHVTLAGVVNSELDRRLAESTATQFGVMSLKNELKTDAEIKEALERL